MLQKMLAKENRHKLIVLLGACAMLLILLSGFTESCARDEPETAADGFSQDDYRLSLEKQLEDMISLIDGAGKASVMITLQSDAKTVYALEESVSSDETQREAETSGSTEQESRVITVERDDGEQPLVVTTMLPDIRGVLVLCEGAADENVRSRVTDAVTTVLGITSRRVCISILEKQEER